MKRASESKSWDSPAGEAATMMMHEILRKVNQEDHVKGPWTVPVDVSEGRLWCDASSLTLGVALEVNEAIVEDSTWLRKSTDCGHINVAELEAVHEKRHNTLFGW